MAEAIVALDEQSAVSVICSVLESRPDLAPSVVNFAVPDLTYPPVKALSERRSLGVIKSFNPEKGFGFIACQELFDVFGNDVFLHNGQLGNFEVGSEVSFAVALNKDNKPQGYDLRAPWHSKGKGAVPTGKGAAPVSKGSYAPKGAQVQVWAPPAQQWSPPADQGKGKGKAAGGYQQAAWPSTPSIKRKWEGEDFKVDKDKELGSFVGFIKSFNHNTGYGFIACEDLQAMGYKNDVFLHHAQLSGHEVGAEVRFTAFLNPKGQPQAKDLSS